MCYYARTLFQCHHEVWGAKVSNCIIADNNRVARLPPSTSQTPASSPPLSPFIPSGIDGQTKHSKQHQLPSNCLLRHPHALQTRRLPRKCDQCLKIDDMVSKIKNQIKEIHESLGGRVPERESAS